MSSKVVALISGVATMCAALTSFAQDHYLSAELEPDRSQTVHVVYDMLKIDAQRAAIAERELLNDKLGIKADANGGKSAQSHQDAPKAPETASAQKSQAPAEPVVQAASKPVVIDVLAMYGIEKNLYIDVDISGTTVRYQKGRPFPLGAADFKFRLIAVDTPCIKLANKETVYTSCLTRAGL